MKYVAVLDISSFIWCQKDFEENKEKYYDLMGKLPDLYDQLLENNAAILLKEELYYEIMQFFPYNSMPNGYEIFERLTFDFLSKICNVHVYDSIDNSEITSYPNLVKEHFSKSTTDEVRYLITRIHSIQEPKNVFFTFEKLWEYESNLSTSLKDAKFEYETVCSDDKEVLIKYFEKYKRKFEHNPKHDKYKTGLKESPLSCFNERTGDITKAQELLDKSYEHGNSFYYFDVENSVWVVFRNHEENRYHGFNQNDREKIPASIRKIMSK
ncbi:hypothetical protein [Flavobacterium sp.]|uniref:hypothetical protein n=1 Tax=Flavobacterium sp. TaxID=239 RepID=UPI0040477DAC